MIFVTGASGFIGRYLVGQLLEQKYEVIVLVRDLTSYGLVGQEYVIEGTLNECSAWIHKLRTYPVQSCIHLAWEGIPDFSFEMCKKNLFYGINVLELCKEVGIKHIVIAGSCGEYQNPSGKITESWVTSYQNHFKAIKNSLHMICDAFCKENKIQYNWLRLFYVYGPGQRKDSLIPHIIREFSNGNQPILNGAYNENDFIYVTDVADAIVKVIERKPEVCVMNIASGHAVRVKDIVKIVSLKLGCAYNENLYNIPEHNVSFYGDITVATKILEWCTKVTLENGIDKLIESGIYTE